MSERCDSVGDGPPGSFGAVTNRLAAAGAAALAVLALAACGAVPESDRAATVGEGVVTVDLLETVLTTLVATPNSGVTEDTATGTVPADTARSVLSTLVNREAAARVPGRQRRGDHRRRPAGVPRLGAGRRPVVRLPRRGPRHHRRPQRRPDRGSRIATPTADELQRRYEEEPETLGVVCVRHVVVGTEAAAEDVLARLDAGESIADVAADVSVDTSTASNGGAVEGTDGSACVPAAALRANAADLADVALASRPGAPAGPAQSQLGWHVVEARPYDEVADSLATLFDASAGDLLFDSALGDIDVDVDPRYGRWDARTRSVVEL